MDPRIVLMILLKIVVACLSLYAVKASQNLPHRYNGFENYKPVLSNPIQPVKINK